MLKLGCLHQFFKMMRLQWRLVGDAAATVRFKNSVGIPVEDCRRRGSAAECLPEGDVSAAQLATRVLLGWAERNCSVAAPVGVSWRRWGWDESPSVEIGRRCRGRGCCSRCCLYLSDVVVKLLDFVVSDVVVRGVKSFETSFETGVGIMGGKGIVCDQETTVSDQEFKTCEAIRCCIGTPMTRTVMYWDSVSILSLLPRCKRGR